MRQSPADRRFGNRIRRSRRCRGISLLEMLVVLTVAISISGATINLMVITRDSHRNAKSNQLVRQEIRRFANDFRRDVHHADRVKVTNGDLLVSGPAETEQFVYSVGTDSTITRSKIVDPAGPVVSSDRYRLGQDATMAFDRGADSHSARLTIRESSRPDRPIEIVATRRSVK